MLFWYLMYFEKKDLSLRPGALRPSLFSGTSPCCPGQSGLSPLHRRRLISKMATWDQGGGRAGRCIKRNMRVWEEEQQEIAEELGDGKMIKLDFWNDNKTVFWVNYNNYCHVIVSWVKAGSFPVLAPGGGHFPPQMLPVLEHQVRMMMMRMRMRRGGMMRMRRGMMMRMMRMRRGRMMRMMMRRRGRMMRKTMMRMMRMMMVRRRMMRMMRMRRMKDQIDFNETSESSQRCDRRAPWWFNVSKLF